MGFFIMLIVGGLVIGIVGSQIKTGKQGSSHSQTSHTNDTLPPTTFVAEQDTSVADCTDTSSSSSSCD
ncbi:hypothetical protein [Lysinibacillus piscis]|uniref:YtzI protein n=1 Tax=Lysinibacillus piscis TaxID=2518931 RepID=A0ABQ5NLS2_9BACI|nr:hypothetical protein [Lysinibacillus sp. KH24]GLC88984.1 hypothetical protein LYSBPC_21110 [Lysinibacillus sp. KH24]